MVTCKLALDLNGQLISSDQSEYQMALEGTYAELLSALEAVLGSRILAEVESGIGSNCVVNGNRASQASNYSGAYLSLFGHAAGGEAADC